MQTLSIAQDPAADDLLGRDPLALLIGMLLDQHMRQRSGDLDGTAARAGAEHSGRPRSSARELLASPVLITTEVAAYGYASASSNQEE